MGADILLLTSLNPTHMPGDDALKAFLESLGHTVTYFDDGEDEASTEAAAAAVDLVFMSESVGSGQVKNEITEVEIPMVTTESYAWDEMGLTEGGGKAQNVVTTDIEIIDPGHYLAAGFSGTVTVLTDITGARGPARFGNGIAGDEADAIATATLVDGQTYDFVFVYEKGAALAQAPADGSDPFAADVRVCLGFDEQSYVVWNENAYALLEAAINYALGLTAPPALASSPTPQDGALHETTSATLSWRPGQFAVSHDIYIGMNFDDVNEATRNSAVFLRNMAENELAIGTAGQPFPEGLEPGATYYWRVDEVNDAAPNSPWKGLVWSFMIRPLIAWNPVPANGVESVYPKQDLSWDIGMGAESHTVYFGESLEAVRDATTGGITVTDPAYDPGQMQPSTTYYWRVDESAGTQTHTGHVWSFTTDHFIVVDDFEDYSDSPGSEPFTVWVDGFLTAADGGNGSGGIIATNLADGQVLLETTDKHGGAQSVPFFYNNTGVSAFDGLPRLTYSQVERSWSTPQDWTVKGLQDLTIWYKGLAEPGSLSYDAATQTYAMTGAGSNVWGSADQFHFAYKELTGDGSITARVDSIPVAPHGDPRIGVMIRDTLDPSAKNATLFVEPDPRTRFTARLQDGGNTSDVAVVGGTPLPTWVRLTREGITVRAERSADGINWSPVTDDPMVSSTQVSLALIDPVYIGLVVCSHASQQFAEATFSNVSIEGNVQPAGPFTVSEDVGITTNAMEPLYAAINGIVVTNDDPAAVNAIEWTQWSIDLSTAAGLNPAAVTKLAIGVGNPQTPQAGGTGMLLLDDIQIRRP